MAVNTESPKRPHEIAAVSQEPTAVPQAVGTQDPTVAEASPEGWRARGLWLISAGRARLAAFGLLLVVGFVIEAVALMVFAALADEVSEGGTQALDVATLAWLHQVESPAIDTAARFFSALGSEVLGVLLVVLVVLFVVRRRWGTAVALVITTIGAQLLNNVLKDAYQRTRPAPVLGIIPAQAFSFPSGHAMVAAAFYTFLAYMSWQLLRGWQRWVVVTALVLLVLLIGWSRLYLGVHYLTDVIAGYIAGFLWAETVIIAGHLLSRRWRARLGAPQQTVVQDSPHPPTPSPLSAGEGEPGRDGEGSSHVRAGVGGGHPRSGARRCPGPSGAAGPDSDGGVAAGGAGQPPDLFRTGRGGHLGCRGRARS